MEKVSVGNVSDHCSFTGPFKTTTELKSAASCYTYSIYNKSNLICQKCVYIHVTIANLRNSLELRDYQKAVGIIPPTSGSGSVAHREG